MNISEYTTVTAVKAFDDTKNVTDDAIILSMIRQTSKEMEDICNRWFNPRIETRTYDTPQGNERNIYFDADLMAVTALTNGDGTVITSGDYFLYPLNSSNKERLFLSPKTYSWENDSNGYPYGAISVLGVWGYSSDYQNAWQDTFITISGSVTASGSNIVLSANGTILPGDLISLNNEYLYVSGSITSGSIVTTWRGVNGSTAATHIDGTRVMRWNPGSEVQNLCITATTAYYMLRQNPTADTTSVDGMTFKTPKDVKKWLEKQLTTLGLTKLGFA